MIFAEESYLKERKQRMTSCKLTSSQPSPAWISYCLSFSRYALPELDRGIIDQVLITGDLRCALVVNHLLSHIGLQDLDLKF